MVKTAVALYNVELAAAYKSFDAGKLAAVASKEKVKMVETYITAYLQSSLAMEAELKTLKFDEVSIDGGKAKVRTTEEWLCGWVDYKTREVKEEKKDVACRMAYTLEKKDGRWLVTDADDLSGKQSK